MAVHTFTAAAAAIRVVCHRTGSHPSSQPSSSDAAAAAPQASSPGAAAAAAAAAAAPWPRGSGAAAAPRLSLSVSAARPATAELPGLGSPGLQSLRNTSQQPSCALEQTHGAREHSCAGAGPADVPPGGVRTHSCAGARLADVQWLQCLGPWLVACDHQGHLSVWELTQRRGGPEGSAEAAVHAASAAVPLVGGSAGEATAGPPLRQRQLPTATDTVKDAACGSQLRSKDTVKDAASGAQLRQMARWRLPGVAAVDALQLSAALSEASASPCLQAHLCLPGGRVLRVATALPL